MVEVRLSARAAADLRNIYDWSLEQFGGAVADTYLDDFQASFALLGDYPQAGDERRDTYRAYRVLPRRNHRIFYRLAEGHVRIICVLHKAQSAEGRL
jgi:toxin ParE1/3/4